MAWTVASAAAGIKNRNNAFDRLPPDAVWFRSFGNSAESGFTAYYRRPNGERWMISNGQGGDDWMCKQLEAK